jgi:hypothetical protein
LMFLKLYLCFSGFWSELRGEKRRVRTINWALL